MAKTTCYIQTVAKAFCTKVQYNTFYRILFCDIDCFMHGQSLYSWSGHDSLPQTCSTHEEMQYAKQ